MFCSVVGPPALCVRINAREMREGRKGAAQEQESSVLLPSYLVDFGICEASSQFSWVGFRASQAKNSHLSVKYIPQIPVKEPQVKENPHAPPRPQDSRPQAPGVNRASHFLHFQR